RAEVEAPKERKVVLPSVGLPDEPVVRDRLAHLPPARPDHATDAFARRRVGWVASQRVHLDGPAELGTIAALDDEAIDGPVALHEIDRAPIAEPLRRHSREPLKQYAVVR